MEKTKSYSGLFIITPEKEEEFDEVKKTIASVISEYEGSISNENVMGKRTLAYPIKKKSEALYYEIIFTAMPGKIAGMSRQFRINTDILRTLIDRVE